MPYALGLDESWRVIDFDEEVVAGLACGLEGPARATGLSRAETAAWRAKEAQAVGELTCCGRR